MGTLNVVPKGEESIAAQSHPSLLTEPCLLFLPGQAFRLPGKEPLPAAFCQYFLRFIGKVYVNGIVPVGTADFLHKGKSQHLGVLPQQPLVCLVPGQAGAVNAALLPGTDADGLTILGIAHGIGLGVLEHDQCYHQVTLGFLRQVVILGHNILQQVFVNDEFVPSLLEGNAEDLLPLHRGGTVGRIDDHNVVVALLLSLQQLQGFFRVAGGDNAVGHFRLNEPGGAFIAHVAKGNPVPEGGHPIRTPCPGIGAGQRGQLLIPHEVNLPQGVRQGQTQGGTGRAYMLKGSGGRQMGGTLQFADQLPAVQCIQKIDVAGLAV